MSGRRRIIAALRRASRNALILGAIETLVLAGGIEIEIMIGDDSRMRGVIAGQDRRMTGAGFGGAVRRSEEHTSELQSLMRISYAVLCLKNTTNNTHKRQHPCEGQTTFM